jgi:hypothetical protein
MPAVTFIGNAAFNECIQLTSVSMPAVTFIGNAAFYSCVRLIDVSIPVVTFIDNGAFYDTGLIDVSMPAATTIGTNTFLYCDHMMSCSMMSATTIGPGAFKNCTQLKTVLMSSVITIGDSAFQNCALTPLTFPDSIESIGAYAFSNNSLFLYDFSQCEQLSYIDPTAFNRSDNSDINVYVTQFTYDLLRIAEFPNYVKFHMVPVSNICFVAGTLVQTDQGKFPIETLTRKNTLRGQPITLTKTKHDDPYLVKIQAYAFDHAPTRDTYMSLNHRVYFNRTRVKARDLVNGGTVSLVDYNGEPLYNVLVKSHTSMEVHGMIVETLDPTSTIALLYTSKLSPNQKNQLIEKMNRQSEYEDIVIHLKRNQ